MRRRRVIVAALVALVAGASACQDTATPLPAAPSLADSADKVFFGLRSNITEGGVRQAELRADTGFMFDESARTELRNVHLTFYTPQGVRDAVLTSREGTLNSRTQQMEARGTVVLVSEDGRRLTSEELRYDQRADQISSDSAFVLIEPGRRLEGIGFRTNSDLTRFQCLQACRGGGAVTIPAP